MPEQAKSDDKPKPVAKKAAPRAEKPRRTRKVGDTTYVLVNGGWKRSG